MNQPIRIHFDSLSAGFALALLLGGLTLVNAQEVRLPPSDQNVVAAITVKRGNNIGASCGESQAVQTVLIFANGTGLSSIKNNGNACAAPGEKSSGVQLKAGAIIFPPRVFQIPASEMKSIRELIRSRAQAALSRSQGQGTSPDSIEQHILAEQTRSVSIAFTDNDLGTPFVSELVRVTDTSPDSLNAGIQLIKEILEKTGRETKSSGLN